MKASPGITPPPGEDQGTTRQTGRVSPRLQGVCKIREIDFAAESDIVRFAQGLVVGRPGIEPGTP